MAQAGRRDRDSLRARPADEKAAIVARRPRARLAARSSPARSPGHPRAPTRSSRRRRRAPRDGGLRPHRQDLLPHHLTLLALVSPRRGHSAVMPRSGSASGEGRSVRAVDDVQDRRAWRASSRTRRPSPRCSAGSGAVPSTVAVHEQGEPLPGRRRPKRLTRGRSAALATVRCPARIVATSSSHVTPTAEARGRPSASVVSSRGTVSEPGRDFEQLGQVDLDAHGLILAPGCRQGSWPRVPGWRGARVRRGAARSRARGRVSSSSARASSWSTSRRCASRLPARYSARRPSRQSSSFAGSTRRPTRDARCAVAGSPLASARRETSCATSTTAAVISCRMRLGPGVVPFDDAVERPAGDQLEGLDETLARCGRGVVPDEVPPPGPVGPNGRVQSMRAGVRGARVVRDAVGVVAQPLAGAARERPDRGW